MSMTLQIINGDIVHSSASGRANVISADAALRQAIVCNLETGVRDNGFGSGIQDLVGTVSSDDATVEILLMRLLINSFTVMQALQSLPPSGQRPDNELISNIRILWVQADPHDPRVYNYAINITTKAGATLKVAGSISQGA